MSKNKRFSGMFSIPPYKATDDHGKVFANEVLAIISY
jgi:hypothetical protein